jgi:Ca2+-transporting ATPase
MILNEGDKIVADGRIISLSNFRTIESILTGETYPISKNINNLSEKTALADRINMVWTGTYVSSGSAEVIVTSTGIHTQIGMIASSLNSITI